VTVVDSSLSLSGLRIVITGASGGIGSEIARACAARGAELLLHYCTQRDQAERLVAELSSATHACQTIQADLSDPESVEDFVRAAWDWSPVIDGWVSNAGADVLTTSWAQAPFEEKLQRLWEVDVLGTIRVGKLVGSHMQRQAPGRVTPSILHVGWDQAFRGMTEEAGQLFGPTKAAVMAFSQHLAQHLAPAVRVNCVAAGWIRTKWGAESASEQWQRRAIAESLLQRWGTAEDVGQLAAFLLSPAAAFINAQMIEVNGGWRRAAD
jgi:3-oxoacyl-[acyl-carrier protein] reductase